MSIHPILDVSRHLIGVKIVEILQRREREKEDNFKYRYSNYKTKYFSHGTPGSYVIVPSDKNYFSR